MTPYTYNTGIKHTDSVYTDSLRDWDKHKHDMLCNNLFGTTTPNWEAQPIHVIEQFLTQYGGKPATLCRIWRGPALNNYPRYWRLDFVQQKVHIIPVNNHVQTQYDGRMAVAV